MYSYARGSDCLASAMRSPVFSLAVGGHLDPKSSLCRGTSSLSVCPRLRTWRLEDGQPMFLWTFIAWLLGTYYDINLLDSDAEADAFYPKFQDYWTYIVVQLAILLIQRVALALLHTIDAQVLLVFSYVIAVFQEYYDEHPWPSN